MAEHNVDLIAKGADHIFHGLGGTVGGVLTGQSRQDLNALLLTGLLITGAAQVGGVVAFLAIDDHSVDVGAQLINGPETTLIGSFVVHGADEGGLAGDTDVGINRQDGDTLIQSGLQSVGSSTGIVGSADDGVNAGTDLLLDHSDLLLDLGFSAGADNSNLDAQLSGSLVAAVLHIAPILGGQGLQDDGNFDIAIGGGGGFSGFGGLAFLGGFGLGLLAAGGQGQDHGHGHEQCKEFLHTSFLLFLTKIPNGAGMYAGAGTYTEPRIKTYLQKCAAPPPQDGRKRHPVMMGEF